jgi:arylsulfatase A-like enzyme
MNVVVVVVDALRASDVGCLGRENDTTPNIDALAEESLVFERAISASNYTDVCMSTIMSGKYPREHGVTHHGTAHTAANLRRIEERSPRFLPELLHEDGYHTIGVDWMGRWHAWGYDDYGVEGMDDNSEDGSALNALLEPVKRRVTDLPEPLLAPLMRRYYRRFGYHDFRIDCEELTEIAIDRIDGADAPVFALLHYWDIHPPYLPPEEYAAEFTYEGEDGDEPLSQYFGPDAKGPMAAEYQPYATGDHRTMADSKEAYDGASKWVDAQLGRLFEYLRERDLFEETMVVLTADHGHNFGEHGIFSDNCGLYDTSLHVPLVVYDPRRGGDRLDGLVQHTDIVPTVLDYAEIETPGNLQGNVLPATREYAFAEAAESRLAMVRTDDWKLIRSRDADYLREQYWYDGDGGAELYDLRADPGETENVREEHPDVAERLADTLERELDAQERAAGGGGRSVEIDEGEMDGLRARLEALGYADDGNV